MRYNEARYAIAVVGGYIDMAGKRMRWVVAMKKSLNVMNAFFLSILVSIIIGISSIAANAATIPTFKTFKKGSIENGVYVIASHDNPNYAVDLYGGKPTTSNNVHLYKKNGTQAQQWYFGCIDAANDIYEIRPMLAAAIAYAGDNCGWTTSGQANSVDVPDINHMALDVYSGGKTNGANVQIYTGNGTASQQWKLIKRSNGSYRIQAMNDTSSTPFLLNIAAEPANNVNMQMWHEYSGVVRTEFDLEKVDDGITRVSSTTLEPVDKNAETIRYSRLQVRDDLQPANSKPVIDTAYTNTRYQDLSASNIAKKKNGYIFNMESSSSKVTMTWAQVGLYDGIPVGVRMTVDNSSPTYPANRCNSWYENPINGHWEQSVGSDKNVIVSFRFAGYKNEDEWFLAHLSGADFKCEFFYTSEYGGKPNEAITPINMKYSIFTGSDLNEDGSGQEGIMPVDKWTGRTYALDISGVSSSKETALAIGRDGIFYYGIYEHLTGSGTFNGVNNAIENAVGLQFKGNGMKIRICDTAGYIGFYMQFDSFGAMPAYTFKPGFTKTVDGTAVTSKAERDKFSFDVDRISAPDGARSFEATVKNGDDGFYIDEKPQYITGDYIYKIVEYETPGYTVADPFYLKETIYYDDDDKMCGLLYSSPDGKAWTPLGDSSIAAKNYAYRVNNATKKSSISLTKTPDKTSITGDEVVQGKTIGYTFTITNTGNQTLDNIELTDSKLQSAPVINWGPPKSPTLVPGQTVTATGTYTLTRDDVSNKPIENTATVTATDELGRTVTSSASATVTPSAISSIFVSKSVSPSIVSTGDASVGETLTWKIHATNKGNQTLTGVTFHDTLDGLSALDIDWDGNQEGRIAPGKSAVATATYRLTAADVKRGYVKNEAYVTCSDLRGNSLTSNHATATATITGKTGLSLEKTTDTPSISADDAYAGKRIGYTIKVTNTGNRKLTGLAISDAKIAPSTASPDKTELGAGESTTATVSYAITDADIAAGRVINTATATATDSDGNTVTSNQGTATTTIETPRPGISVTKEVDKTVLTGDEARAGTKLTYAISVTNTGNTTVSGLTATDTMRYDGNPTLDFGTIAPGKTVKIRAQHTVTQDEVDAGRIVNAIVVSGSSMTSRDSVETSISPSSSLTVSKSVDTADIAADEAIAGKRLTYTITVRNSGNSTVTGVSLADELNGASVGELGKTTLAPGEQTTATATYSITTGDIAAGSVVNAVTAKGTAPSGKSVTSNRATVRTDIEAPRPALSVSKTVDKTSLTGAEAHPGTKLSYTITVTNGGNSTVSGIRLDDSMDGASGPLLAQLDRTELAAGETATARVSYTVTQSDIDKGRVTNTVQASGTGVGGTSVTSGRSSATTSIEASDSITVSKAVDRTEIPPSSAVPGTTLSYTFTVSNTGTRTLKSVSIADSIGSIGKITPAKTTLAPGEETTATASYRITAADIKAGRVVNSATASGTNPSGSSIKSAESSVTTTITGQRTGITLTKTVDKDSLTGDGAKAGAELAYGFRIANTGNVAIEGITINDGLTGISKVTVSWPGAEGRLDAGQTATGTASYTVSQADIDRGSVTNTAKASGENPTTGETVESNESSVTTRIDRTMRLAVSKKADPTTIPASEAKAGKEITYSISVRNAGNVTTDITATDSMAEIGTVTMSKSRLAPNETATATVRHAITDAEINAGIVTNTVTVGGTMPDGSMTTSGRATAQTTIEKPAPKLTLEKTVDKKSLTADESKVGAKLHYSFKLTNAGNVAIDGISIDDKLEGISSISMRYPTTDGTLAPGEVATGTATYSITDDDISVEFVKNIATAIGSDTVTGNQVKSNKAGARTDIVRNLKIGLEKTSNPTRITAEDAVVGKEIEYRFKVTNTGNCKFVIWKIEDSLDGISEINGIKLLETGLEPGESTTGTATYRLKQSDIDAGKITNEAVATALIMDIADAKSNRATVTTPIEQPRSGMSFEKTVDRKQLTGGEARAGTKLTYSFKISNTGNIAINDIAIDDDLPGLSDISIDWKGHDRSLPAGSSVTGTATYTVTQEDVDAGKVKNTAIVTGTDSHGGPLTSSSSASTSIERNAAIETVKTVDKTAITGDAAKPGTEIRYTVKVTNTGNVTLRNVTCDDSMRGIGRIALDRTQLAPGETATGTASHAITQSDIDSGVVTNTASSSADAPDASKAVSNESTVTTNIERTPRLTLAKTTERTHIPADEARVGEKIPYELTLENTGNATVSDIDIADALADRGTLRIEWGGKSNHSLTPGETVKATATHTVTEADIDAGIVENTAKAGGKAPDGKPIESNAAKTATTIEKRKPSIALVKTGTERVSGDDVKPGTEIEFRFEVENNGNVTLKGIAIDDALDGIGDIELDRTELTAGEKTSGTAKYTITQVDIDAGVVKNTAIAKAEDVDGNPVESNESEHDVEIEGTSSLAIEKTVDRESLDGRKSELDGTQLTYSFTVTNTGTTTISGISIDDAMKGLGDIEYGEKKGTKGVADTKEDDASTKDNGKGKGDASDSSESVKKGDTSDKPAGGSIFLAPGESITARATYRITDGDIEAGEIRNTAKAVGKAPIGDGVESKPAEAVTTIKVEPDPVDEAMSDLMQTGKAIAIPSAAAIAGICIAMRVARRKRQRR